MRLEVGLALSVVLASSAPLQAQCHIGQLLELKVTMSGPRPLVDLKVNDTPARFIVDSGAFFSTISPGSAAELGLHTELAPASFHFGGIGGSIRASVTRVKKLTLGRIDVPNVQFVVGGSETGATGLLGQNVLGLGDVEYDLQHGSIRLMRPKGCKDANLAYWAGGRPVSMVELAPRDSFNPHTIGTGQLNGQRVKIIFDTGAASTMVTLRAAKRLGIDVNGPGVVPGGASRGLGSQVVQNWIVPFASVKIGDEEIRNVKLRVADTEFGGDGDMLLGADFFLSHRLYVSNAERRLFLTYDGGPVFGKAVTKAVTDTGAVLAIPSAAEAKLPETAEEYSRRGAAAAARREFQAAIDDFTHAIALAPSEARYTYQRAMARIAARQPLMAMDDLNSTLALDPANSDARITRASLRVRAHDSESALQDLNKAEATLRPSSDLRLIVAQLYSELDQFDMAIRQFGLWVDAHPADSRRPNALNGRCWARALANRELNLALKDCNQALKARPDDLAFLDSRALVKLRTGDTDGALEDYNAAIEKGLKNAWTLLGRSLAESRKGLKTESERDRSAALALNPKVLKRAKMLGLS